MEFLKREGLYSPQMKEICPQDPVATDLIGALLTQGPTNVLSSRRSSNDSIIRSGRQSASSGSANKTKAPTQLSELMETALEWDFEIFKLEDLTEKRPLVYLGEIRLVYVHYLDNFSSNFRPNLRLRIVQTL